MLYSICRVEAMSKTVFTFAIVGFFLCAQFAQAEMTSTNFKIRWDAVSTGGSDTSSSASYQLRDSVDGSAADKIQSTNYQVDSGYRAGIYDQILTFDVQAQNMASGRAASAVSGTTVTASESGLSVGDMIALIQDQGGSQVVAIGRVNTLGSGSFSVDFWTNNGTAPTIDGTNDYVYPISGTSIAMGDLATGSVSTAVISMEVTIENDNGYVVQIMEDGELRDGVNDISDVADGTVSAGSEEYGARSSDTSISGSTFDTADSAITTTFQDVATVSSAAFESRNFLILKAGIDGSTTAGSYAHTLSIVASGTF
jgi:hypothetical protein